MPRIYISPSSQERNRGISPYTVEEVEMNKIADILVPLLNKDGRFTVKRNSPSWDVSQMASDSNNFKADIHLAIHSNAGGGVGTEVYAYGPGTNSERFAKALYNQVAPLSPGKDRGVKFNKGLYEVGDNVKATSALIELGFHDNSTDAQWLHGDHQQIAEALYKGVCDFYAYDYRSLVIAPVVVAPVVPDVMYRIILDGVQTMAIADQEKAIAIVHGSVDTGAALNGIVQRTDGVEIMSYVKPVMVVAPDPDIYLSVRVRVSKADELTAQIIGMGYATKKLELA